MDSPARMLAVAFAPDSPPHPVEPLQALERLGAAAADQRFAWIDVEGEWTAATESLFREKLGWHPIVFQNIRQESARARMTPFEDYTHFTFSAPAKDSNGIIALPDAPGTGEDKSVEIDAVLGPDYLITFHRVPVAAVELLISELPALKSPPKSADLILYRLVSAAIEAMGPAVDALDAALGGLEEEALNRPKADLLERIVYVRDELYMLHLSLAPQLQMLHDVSSGASPFVTPFARPFFRSVENRVRGLIDDVAIYKEFAQNTLELYRSAITHKTNEIIRALTVISTPLLVLSFLTGAYGMNVPLPGSGSRYAFIVILGISGALFLGMLWWFRRRQWF